MASFTADGAYDQEGVSAAVAKRHPDAAVIVPPRSMAVPSDTAQTDPMQRDQHLQSIAEHGRTAWQRAYGYTKRARAEAAIGRFKQVIGDGLRLRTDGRRHPCAQPHDGAWTPDLRPHRLNPERGWGNCAYMSAPFNTVRCAASLKLSSPRFRHSPPGWKGRRTMEWSSFPGCLNPWFDIWLTIMQQRMRYRPSSLTAPQRQAIQWHRTASA